MIPLQEGGICKTHNDNLAIILKTGVQLSLKGLFTLSIRYPIQNIGRKKFVRSFVNTTPVEKTFKGY
jgi:hypothetical protein